MLFYLTTKIDILSDFLQDDNKFQNIQAVVEEEMGYKNENRLVVSLLLFFLTQWLTAVAMRLTVQNFRIATGAA